jgi:protein-S-isoprenylcysteine O-methyltransferase Ste14
MAAGDCVYVRLRPFPVNRPLSFPLRMLLVPWNVLATLACFTMFTWLVHDRHMPGWPAILDRTQRGPVWTVGGGLATAVLVDVLLFAAFGLLHAGAARRGVYLLLGQTLGIVHKQALRTAFMTLTALAWLGLLLCWQPTGRDAWDLTPALAAGLGLFSRAVVDDAAKLVSFGFVLLCLGTVVRHGAFRFIGLRQLLTGPERSDDLGAFVDVQQASRPVLLTTGIYGVVRHPMYMYLLAAVVVRPTLSMDLLIWLLCAIAFLLIALPLEEEKLIAIFGDQYRDYRRRIPAFIPFWPMGLRGS